MWPAAIAFDQPQSDAPPASQSSQQSPSQTQSQPPQKEESAADATKKAEKEKAKPKKVYTEEDLAGLRGNGVSVVGEDKPAGPGRVGTEKTNAQKKSGNRPQRGTEGKNRRGKTPGCLRPGARTRKEDEDE